MKKNFRFFEPQKRLFQCYLVLIYIILNISMASQTKFGAENPDFAPENRKNFFRFIGRTSKKTSDVRNEKADHLFPSDRHVKRRVFLRYHYYSDSQRFQSFTGKVLFCSINSLIPKDSADVFKRLMPPVIFTRPNHGPVYQHCADPVRQLPHH